jgi:hypothetical protein
MKMRSGGRKRAAETENGLSRLEMGGGDWKWVVEPENEWYGIRESGCNNSYVVRRLFSVIVSVIIYKINEILVEA